MVAAELAKEHLVALRGWVVSAEEIEALYVSRFGPPSDVFRYGPDQRPITVFRWATDVTNEGVNLYATLGASFAPMQGSPWSHRIEFHLGLLPDAPDVASSLGALAAYVAVSGVQIGDSHSFSTDGSLWRGARMGHLLIVAQSSDTIIPPLECADGTHITFLPAVPVYGREL